MTVKYVGVDGCPGGWFSIAFVGTRLEARVDKKFDGFQRAYQNALRICIDIPIGLPSENCKKRPCEKLARSKLGDRRSSVFPVPSRVALEAKDYDDAKQLNKRELGVSLSKQSFSIGPKIKQVDQALCANNSLRTTLVEIHPEVCFWALAGATPMANPKSIDEGIEERLEILEMYLPAARDFYSSTLSKWPRKDVGRDDIVDALVALVTASAPSKFLRRLSGDPSHDECGLPMAMTYVDPLRVRDLVNASRVSRIVKARP